MKSFEKLPGDYEIRLLAQRFATAADFEREQAKRKYEAAEKLRITATLASRKAAVLEYREAIRLFISVKDADGEGKAPGNLGLVLNSLGDNQGALDAHRQALDRKRALQDGLGEATVLHNLGSAHFDMGDLAKALDHFSKALALFQALGAKDGEARSLLRLARGGSRSRSEPH